MHVNQKPMTIIGAGPSGLTVAIALARNHYPVHVFEQHSKVGARFHGDFQGIENWTSEEDAMDEIRRILGPEFHCSSYPFFRIDIYNDKRDCVRVDSEKPLFYLVQRGSDSDCFDQALRRCAEEAGVHLQYNTKVTTLAEPAILATGPKVADAIAAGILFETNMNDMAVAILDPEIAPGAYAYLLVCQGRATLATMLCREFRHEKRYLERTLEAFHEIVKLDIHHEKPFGGFGNFFLHKPKNQRRKIFVGECGGFQDALFGFGIRNAIRSGHVAAQSILNGEPFKVLADRYLGPTLKAGMVNRFLFEILGRFGPRWIFTKLRSSKNPYQLLTAEYRFSLLKRLIYPLSYPFYLKRKHFKDQSCTHDDCGCVWCKHQSQNAHLPACKDSS